MDPEAAVSRAAANVIAVLVFGARLAQEPEFAEVNALIRGQLATVDLNLPAIILGRYACAQCLSSVFVGYIPFGDEACHVTRMAALEPKRLDRRSHTCKNIIFQISQVKHICASAVNERALIIQVI